MKAKKNRKAIWLLLVLSVIFGLWFLGGKNLLKLEYLKSQLTFFNSYVSEKPTASILIFFVVYVITTAASFPGAALLTLLAGALFGDWMGTLIVSFASTIGATLAFLGARFFFREWVESKFREKIKTINSGIESEGNAYLISLRLIPAVPFFVVNLVMGITKISLKNFYLYSQIAMLPGTVVYVHAGKELSKIDSLSGLISLNLLTAFVLLGLFPVMIKPIVKWIKTKKLYSKFKKPRKFDYNLIVIGAGSAGLVTAYIASAIKAKVALIEKHKMGGDCLNTGCVPSKALIRSAKFILESKKAKELGFKETKLSFDFAEIMERVQKIIKKIEPHDSIERYSQLGVECIEGEAKIISPYEIRVNGKTLTTKNIVISTGAAPSVPLIPGLDKIPFLTSDTIWNLRKQPKRILVLGGGPIGCELAQAFSAFGCEVTIIEKFDRIMGREDLEVSQHIEKIFIDQKIKLMTSAEVTHFSRSENINYLHYNKENNNQQIEFDEILVALGRSANTSRFGLEELDVKLNENGTIKVDSFMRTNFPNIYACGDVAGPFQFTHVAAHQAWYASVNALFSPFKKFKIDFRVIPWTTFVNPEVSRVGLNEEEAKKTGVAYEVSRFELSELDRAIADSSDHGFLKVLTKPNSDAILGVTIVSDRASDMLSEFVFAMKNNLGLKKIMGTIHAYPTMSEANKYVSGVWQKNHVPQKTLRWLQKFHAWRRG